VKMVESQVSYSSSFRCETTREVRRTKRGGRAEEGERWKAKGEIETNRW